MLQFILTVVQDEGMDEEIEENLSLIIDDQFSDFIDGIMQDYPQENYQSSVDWTCG
jgi:hypothetical protein